MFDAVRQNWRELKRARPGQRFQQHYRRRHEGSSSPWRRLAFLAAGGLVVAAGIFFLPAPGPGFVIIALGGGLLAQESKHAAKLLDAGEVRVRVLLSWVLRQWQRAPAALRGCYVLFAVAAAAAGAYLAYRVLF